VGSGCRNEVRLRLKDFNGAVTRHHRRGDSCSGELADNDAGEACFGVDGHGKGENSVSSVWYRMEKKDGVNELEVNCMQLLVVFSQPKRLSGSGSAREGVGRHSGMRREQC
jgi:hypothetical protein